MTGTAVNPLLRAAYMAHCTDLKVGGPQALPNHTSFWPNIFSQVQEPHHFCLYQVTFVAPWLAKCDQDAVFPNNLSFEAPEEQEGCMREWVKQRTGLSPSFDIVWYPGLHLRAMHFLTWKSPGGCKAGLLLFLTQEQAVEASATSIWLCRTLRPNNAGHLSGGGLDKGCQGRQG